MLRLKTHNKVVVVAIFVLALGLLLGGKVRAATPPDACFNFNSGTGTIEDYYDYENDDSLNPACTRDVDIPATIASTAVTAIGNNSFSNKLLTSVTIPNSVLTIGNSAFHTNQITSVTIPNSVSFVDNLAFYNNGLISLSLGNSVDSIGSNAFELNQLTSITIPNSVTTIGDEAFKGNGLTSLTLGNSVTIIGSDSFQDNQLSSVIIPDSVTDIGDGAFSGNNISSLTLGNSVTIIGSTAFNGNLLTSVIIPNSVTIIRANSFSANLLSSLTLGSSVSTIGDSAFGGNQLTSVAIPDSVTTIDPMAFVGNSSLDVNTTEPMFLSGDPVQVQQVYDSIRLVHLFTVNSSNPNNLQDSVVTEAVLVGMDLNGNGNQNDVLGGHLINPADAENDVLTSSGGSVSGLASTGQNTVPMAVVSIILVTISSCFLMYTRRKQW